MKTYKDYYNEWQCSTESRDLAFDEWLMLLLDRKERDFEEAKRQRDAYYDELTRLRQERVELIEKACSTKKSSDMDTSYERYLQEKALLEAYGQTSVITYEEWKQIRRNSHDARRIYQ